MTTRKPRTRTWSGIAVIEGRQRAKTRMLIELPFIEVVRFDQRERDLKANELGGSSEKICDLFERGKDAGVGC